MQTKLIKKIIGISGSVLFIAFIIIGSIIIISKFGNILNNPEAMRKNLSAYGIWSVLLFILLNMFQIFFAPIPGHFINVAAGAVFGSTKGIVISWIGVIMGGTLVMLTARYFGKKALYYILDEKALRFEREITKRGLPFILFLSVFPNPIGDGIFYLAGITNLPLKILMPMIFIGRIPGLILSVLIGDKLYGAGVNAWVIGGTSLITALILYFVFRKNLENFFERLIKDPGVKN